MSSLVLDKLRQLKDVSFHVGADGLLIDRFERDHRIVLPLDHRAALQVSNGIEAYSGYIRLFGIHTTHSIDAIAWNQADYWKFAWRDRSLPYWCFGETAWGDQFAYNLAALRGLGSTEVYFLDALSMTPQVVASSFTEFLEKEFVRSATEPYDAAIKQAREKLGPLEVSCNLVYIPSILLGGVEDVANVAKMNARSAMICNGDIATQLDEGPPDRAVKGVEPYEDESNRMRLRLVWD